MKPSTELRARILDATSPKSYKLEDYRKVGSEDMRWYKWGFYAAALFMIAIAMWEYNMRGSMQGQQQEIARLKSAGQQVVAQNQQMESMINALLNPGAQITWNDNDTKKPFARAVLGENGTAILIVPTELVAPGSTVPQLTLTDSTGKTVTFSTQLISAPAGAIHLTVPKNAPEIAKMFSQPQQVTPGKPGEPLNASMIGGGFHP